MKKISTFLLLALSSLVYASVGDTITTQGVQYVVKTEDTLTNKYEARVARYAASRIVVPDSVISGLRTYYVTEVPRFFDSITCQLTHYTKIDYSQCAHLNAINRQATVEIDIDTLILPPDLQRLSGIAFYSADPSRRQTALTDPDKLQKGIHRIFSSGQGSPNLAIQLLTCGALQEVDLSSYTAAIEAKYVITNCYFLEKCILPNTLKGGLTFCGDIRLKNFNMPDSLEIMDGFFGAGVPISHIHIGSKVKGIGPQTLYGWQYLDSISVDSANQWYCVVDGALFTRDTTLMIHYPYSRNANTYIMPPQTKCIWGITFAPMWLPEEYAKVNRHKLNSSAGSLRTLVVNEGLEEIQSWSAFARSSIRKVVNLENSHVWRISTSGFSRSNIDTLILPPTLKELDCCSLDESLGAQSFAFMRSLRCLDFSRADSLQIMRHSTMEGDINLDSIDLLHCSLLTELQSAVCKGDSGMRFVALPRYIKAIGQEAFSGCVSLTRIICPAFTPIRLTPGMKVFDGVNTSTCELIVPSKSVPLYQQAPVWKDFQISSNGLYTIEGLPSDSLGGMVSGTGAYLQGETATLTALPTEGYEFISWDDGNTDNPRQVLAAQDTTLVALFQLISGLTHTENDAIDPMQKTMKNGNIYIQRGEDLYTIHGEVIKTN